MAMTDTGRLTLPARLEMLPPYPLGDESSDSFVRRVLMEAGVVLMPGSSLGAGRAALTVEPPMYAEAAARLRGLL